MTWSSVWEVIACNRCGTQYTSIERVNKPCGQRACSGIVQAMEIPRDQPQLRHIIAAIELALEAAADDRAARAVTAELVKLAPARFPGATEPVHLLLSAIREANAEFRLTDGPPHA